jgi:hypothetical protein
MTRAVLILNNDEIRAKAINWIKTARAGSRVELKGPQRTLDQSSHMYAALTEIASQHQHHGRYYSPDIWKCLFLSALGREYKFAPAIDDENDVPVAIGPSSSDLSVKEMSDLIDLIYAKGSEWDVTFHYPDPRKEQ